MNALKTLLLLVAVALLLGWFLPTPNYEEFVAGVETRRLQENGKCPLSEEALEDVTPEVAVLCANYGLAAYLDAKQNQAAALRVYGILGQTAELHEVRRIYGSKVIAVIDSYYTEGSRVAQISNKVGGIATSLWDQLTTDPLNVSMPDAPADLKPEELAVYALLSIKDGGEIFLAQFEVLPDGSAVRKPVESVAQNAYSILMGGVRNIERKVVLGEHITPYEFGEAALDVAVVFAGVKLLTKPAATLGKAGKFTAATARAMRAITAGVKIGAVGVVGVAAYVAVTDPLEFITGVTSASGWIAEQVGLPAWVGKAMAWFFILLVGWTAIRIIYKLVRLVTTPYRMVHRRSYKRA